MAASRFWSFDGSVIVYDDLGEGPPVVALHGFLGTHATWTTDMGAALVGSGHRLIAPDLRGHGLSSKPHDLAAYEDRAIARDVVALADHLRLEQYDLVGCSLGAIVAGSVVQLDARVRRLVLHGVGHWVTDPNWDRPRRLVRALVGSPGVEPGDPVVDVLMAIGDQLGADRLALAGVQHGHVPLLPDDLARITTPTLVLCGEDDHVNGDPARLAAAIPGAALQLTPGGHDTALARPESIQALLDFLDRDPATPA